MKKFSLGLFGLALLLGNQLGSAMGIAIAICGWMILDGLVETITIGLSKNRELKKEGK
jgi:hypothetical protein